MIRQRFFLLYFSPFRPWLFKGSAKILAPPVRPSPKVPPFPSDLIARLFLLPPRSKADIRLPAHFRRHRLFMLFPPPLLFSSGTAPTNAPCFRRFFLTPFCPAPPPLRRPLYSPPFFPKPRDLALNPYCRLTIIVSLLSKEESRRPCHHPSGTLELQALWHETRPPRLPDFYGPLQWVTSSSGRCAFFNSHIPLPDVHASNFSNSFSCPGSGDLSPTLSAVGA